METMNFSGYTHRFLARFVIEAETPLAVGSGEKDIITDAVAATDVNGLPYIPGTAIAGVVRHLIEEARPEGLAVNDIFGFQKEREGLGSKIIFTEAKILNSKGEVMDGLNPKAKKDELLKHYTELPVRQHVRINEKGVTDRAGKFDEQVVFAGTRFCFELEMVAENDDLTNFDAALQQIQRQSFRIGSGTRCGFGEIKIVELQKRCLDLKKPEELLLYLSKSSQLSAIWNGWEKQDIQCSEEKEWVEYILILQPDDFFLFGSGFGDEEVSMTPVKAKKVDWSSGVGVMKENLVLIPATSVKGALAHRVAYHYNRLLERFAGCEGEKKPRVGNENEAVQALFGYESQDEKTQVRGNLLFSDVIEKPMADKILNHVAIDRFTGGAIDGTLFSEKTTYGKGHKFTLTILAKDDAIKDEKTKESLESAMIDICKGMLPLGGGVNRGNGVFTGCLTKNGEVLYESK